MIIGREFAAKMDAMFDNDLAQSHAIDAQSWSRRPLLMRIKEWMAQIWARLL